jgi:subtilisin family serine protease
MNVAAAWALGYTGKKVVVTILDDGIQPDHPDLEINYVRQFDTVCCPFFPADITMLSFLS